MGGMERTVMHSGFSNRFIDFGAIHGHRVAGIYLVSQQIDRNCSPMTFNFGKMLLVSLMTLHIWLACHPRSRSSNIKT
jgi:hypothetical protein